VRYSLSPINVIIVHQTPIEAWPKIRTTPPEDPNCKLFGAHLVPTGFCL